MPLVIGGDEDEVEDPVAQAIDGVAFALKYLGNGSSSSPMGAIEFHSVQVKSGLDAIAAAISDHAEAVRELAEAVNGR